eukprot:GGOE01004443.1.p4 GENE.GGOE01004443.1~~GGOE01004443.1.p4  ORF type:complete len:133 (+),score=29.24 GGOE01004443.1:200-598(+)
MRPFPPSFAQSVRCGVPRSFTITAAPGTAHLAVDSYGKLLAEEAVKLSRKEFNRLVKSVAQCRNCLPVPSNGGTGGTSEVVTTLAAGQTVFSGRTYHCAGQQSGDLCGGVDQFSMLMKALFPELDELTRTSP